MKYNNNRRYCCHLLIVLFGDAALFIQYKLASQDNCFLMILEITEDF